MAKETLEKEPIKEPEIIEPEPSPEEQKRDQISRERDAEQVRVHALNECGTPMKYMIIRSPKVAEEIVIRSEYYALTDGDKIIGYQRWGETRNIQPRGTAISSDLIVIGERQRGE